MLRAIYIGDVRFDKCNVFQYDEKDQKFKMINEPEIWYSPRDVMNDDDFQLFFVTKDGEDGSSFPLKRDFKTEDG